MPRVKIHRRPRTWSAYSHPEGRAEALDDLRRPDREWVASWAAQLSAAVQLEYEKGRSAGSVLRGAEAQPIADSDGPQKTLLASARAGQ